MVGESRKTEELTAEIETTTPSASPAGIRTGSVPKRLSKGQRKHVRRQKQAGQARMIERRR